MLAYSLYGEVKALIDEPYEGYESAVLNTFGWGMIAAILILAVIFTLLPWRGAKHLDGPPETDDDPSDATYEELSSSSSGSPTETTSGASPGAAPTDIRKEG